MCRPPSAARESPLVAELYHIEAGRMFVFLCLPLVDAMYVAACQSVVCLVAGSLTVASLVCTYSMSRNLRCMYLDMDIISVFPSRSLLGNHPFSAVYICSHCKSYRISANPRVRWSTSLHNHALLPTNASHLHNHSPLLYTRVQPARHIWPEQVFTPAAQDHPKPAGHRLELQG